jgi:parallel beta-helix repeat protein
MTCSVDATTIWNSDIVGNVTWTTTGSPYLVTTSITVQRQAILTIQAGVIVKMSSGKSITVTAPLGAEEGGRIISQGTLGNPVVFTSYRDDAYGGDTNDDGPSTGQIGDWYYIRFNNGNNTLENCLIRYGGYANTEAVYVYQCSPTIRNNVIEYSAEYGVYCYKMTSGSITGNTIRNCGNAAGDNGIHLSQSSPTIENCIIVNNRGYGICENDTSSDPVVKYCLFNNNQDGDYCDENLYVYKGANNINNNVAGASNNIDGNPSFKNTVDYHLSFGSPCIDAGDPAGTYTGQKDIDGEARVLNGRVDIGADEYGGGQGGVKPIISNVTANQKTDGSKVVDIYYDLADQDSLTLSVSVKVSSDGGSTYTITPASLSGDVGASVARGIGKHIVWNASNDLPGAYGTNYKVKVCANDGSGDVFGYSNVFVIDNRTGSGFRITSLVPTYTGVFPEGVEIINTFTATVDWGGKTPLKVIFRLNGTLSEVVTSGNIVQKTYNMGQDLQYSYSGAKNELLVYAVAADGQVSQPAQLYLSGLELPEWAISRETKPNHPRGNPNDPRIGWRFEPLTGKLTFYGDVEVLKGGIKGTVNIPESIPEVGGKWGVEINPLTFEWELSAQPRLGDGTGLTGSFDLAGSWGAEAACGTKRKGEISATLSGAGEFYPEFRLKDVSAELAGSFTFLFPRVPLICQWTGCCHTGYCPYFQASIAPEITGTVGMEEGEPSLVAGLKFKNAELNIGVTLAGTVGAGSEGSIYYIAGTIGGKPYIILQFPGDPYSSCLNEYIKEVGFVLNAKVVFECAWWKWEQELTFDIYKCPQTGALYALGRPSGERQVVLVQREYLNAPEGYCVFPETGAMGILSVGGLPQPILNVGTGPMPSVAATSDNGLLLFVYDDANKPTGKHQEIYYARWSGSQWTSHVPLTSNMSPDTMPVAAIDDNGNQIAVWVGGPEPNGFETGPRDVLPGFEIKFSTNTGGAWSVPQQLTNNSYTDILPWFEKLPSGALRVCWISSPINAIPVWHDEEISPFLNVFAADWNGVNFGTPFLVAGGLRAVSPPSICRTNTQEFLAYLKDMDLNSGTAEDREVIVRVRTIGGVWGADEQLTNDGISDTAAQVALDENGVPVLVWVKRMVPKPLPDGNNTHVDQLWFTRWNGTVWGTPITAFENEGLAEPKLIRNADGKLILFWVAASKEFSDIFYTVYDSALEKWGLPQQITRDQGAETMISLTESAGNILAAYVKRRIDLSDPNLPQIGLSDIYLMEHVPVKDLFISADDVSLSPDITTELAMFVAHWLDNNCWDPNWCDGYDFDYSGIVNFVDYATMINDLSEGSDVAHGHTAKVSAIVHLSGDFRVEDVLVKFFDGDPNVPGTLIGTQSIDTILPGEGKVVSITWCIPNDANSHPVYVVVDPNNTIPETDDVFNNKASIKLFEPDLKAFMPIAIGYPSANIVNVGLTIKNMGSSAAGQSFCQVHKNSVTGPVIRTIQVPALEAGAPASFQFAWDVSGEEAGIFTLAVIADTNDVVKESFENNNTASGQIRVLPDWQAEQWSADVNNTAASAIVHNVGVKPSVSNLVRVTYNGQKIGEAAIGAINPGESKAVSIPISQPVSYGRVEITVNPYSDGSDEVTLLNNTATIIIFSPADFEPDGDIDADDLKILCQEWLQTSGTLKADIAPDPKDGIVNFLDFAKFALYWFEASEQ